jgi:hypothetical protein
VENFGQSLSDLEQRRALLSHKLSRPLFVPSELDAESKASVRAEHIQVHFSGGHTKQLISEIENPGLRVIEWAGFVARWAQLACPH